MKKEPSNSRIARVFKRIINVRFWSDWDRMKFLTSYLGNGFKRFFVPQEQEASESFNDAKLRLNLSEADLMARKKGLLRLSIVMLIIAALVFIYLLYQLILGNFVSSALSIVVVGIALVLSFRYHFWYYQIQQRKLGCSFQQWFHGLMGGKR